ncbi:hypothetical protein MARPU_12225 [Marichromatium purpuratum 984]|uniref:Uncharacterized protein n=1 Tax=Marichromatium purpuratum 984 TaxID=765910 RepID=W0E4A0_MARPU|nr:hypothetical protein [Marichromatium purpuratum]AHF05577.1 hypothetical protein MARPU_12225 [Marichromatium purpuratum 984]
MNTLLNLFDRLRRLDWERLLVRTVLVATLLGGVYVYLIDFHPEWWTQAEGEAPSLAPVGRVVHAPAVVPEASPAPVADEPPAPATGAAETGGEAVGTTADDAEAGAEPAASRSGAGDENEVRAERDESSEGAALTRAGTAVASPRGAEVEGAVTDEPRVAPTSADDAAGAPDVRPTAGAGEERAAPAVPAAVNAPQTPWYPPQGYYPPRHPAAPYPPHGGMPAPYPPHHPVQHPHPGGWGY